MGSRAAAVARRRAFLVLFLLASGALAFLLWPLHGRVLNWDEVDYVEAARLGVTANALEKGSLSGSDYFGYALEKITGGEYRVPSGYDENADPLIRRHYHPPFLAYLTSLFYRAAPSSERAARAAQLVAVPFYIGLSMLSYRQAGGQGLAGLIVVAACAVASGAILFGSLGNHGWMAVWSLAICLCLSGMHTITRANLAGLGLLLGLSAVTLETAAIVALGVCVFLAYSGGAPGAARAGGLRLPRVAKHSLLVISVSLLSMAAFWPGSLIKASVVKIPALYLYRLKMGEEYSGVSILASAIKLYPLFALAVAGCLYLVLHRRRSFSDWGPCAVLGGFYTACLLPFSLSESYILPGLMLLAVAGAVAVDCVGSRPLRAASGLTVSTLVLMTVGCNEIPKNTDSEAGFAAVEKILKRREAFIDGGHIYQYYLPEHAHRITPVSITPDGEKLLVREALTYHQVQLHQFAGKAVILQARPGNSPYAVESRLQPLCEPTQIPGLEVRAYLCNDAAGAPAADSPVPQQQAPGPAKEFVPRPGKANAAPGAGEDVS